MVAVGVGQDITEKKYVEKAQVITTPATICDHHPCNPM
jgi:hypothetical protein